MARWYVMRCKHRNESLVWQQLCSRKSDSYWPRISLQPVESRSGKSASFFPGYLFAYADLDIIGASALQWIPGAIGMVCFGGEPAYVSDSILQGIRERVDAVNAMAGQLLPSFRAGDEVEIYSGPFAGYRGIFGRQLPDRERAIVFLNFIRDQQMRVELSVTQIRGTKQDRTRL